MIQQYINIYQSARQAAGITQERAAERIGKSVESVRAYESDARLPDDDTVVLMADVYGAQYLAYQHLQKSSLGQKIMPEIEPKDLPEAILKVLKEVNDLLECRNDLIKIGCDGVITAEEQIRFNEILREFDDVKRALIAFEYSKQKPQV